MWIQSDSRINLLQIFDESVHTVAQQLLSPCQELNPNYLQVSSHT